MAEFHFLERFGMNYVNYGHFTDFFVWIIYASRNVIYEQKMIVSNLSTTPFRLMWK